ncbi:secretion protein [Parashewanella tropica]|uniref:secretion protein n=1 Tax=Parashewanella tropica TaxID=2547970 RepID=UPI0010597D04|nr:secretion protein [Parashewanella tropica]
MDEVTYHLQQQGIVVQPAYFGESQFEYGKRWETEHWRLIYRVEDHVMTICEIESKSKPEGIRGAMLDVISQLKKFKKEITSLKSIRGRVLTEFGSPQERERRQLQEKLYLKQGAKKVENEEGIWLVY